MACGKGAEIILTMRERMKAMEQEMQAFMDFAPKEIQNHSEESRGRIENALVRVGPPHLVRRVQSR
jgi:hypothetical protein